MQNKKTSISDEKVKEILIDGINTGANYILNKTNFYEHVRTFFKIEKQRCLRLYDLHYNNAQIERNNIKTELGIVEEQSAVKRNILSKHDALEILTEIAQGKVKKVEGTLIIPSPSDRKGAIESIAKIEGWNAPTKSETDVTINKTPFFGEHSLNE
jgi:hypothetical protein